MILVLREAQVSPKITGLNNGEVDNKAEKNTLTLRGPLQHYKLVKMISRVGKKVCTHTHIVLLVIFKFVSLFVERFETRRSA